MIRLPPRSTLDRSSAASDVYKIQGNHLPGNIIRKILLLRALINSPRLILLEEPWFGFSDETKKNVQNILLQNSKNSTVVIISNDESFALKCDKSIYLTEDKINIIISNTKK